MTTRPIGDLTDRELLETLAAAFAKSSRHLAVLNDAHHENERQWADLNRWRGAVDSKLRGVGRLGWLSTSAALLSALVGALGVALKVLQLI